jgi:hypothetical protein
MSGLKAGHAPARLVQRCEPDLFASGAWAWSVDMLRLKLCAPLGMLSRRAGWQGGDI